MEYYTGWDLRMCSLAVGINVKCMGVLPGQKTGHNNNVTVRQVSCDCTVEKMDYGTSSNLGNGQGGGLPYEKVRDARLKI